MSKQQERINRATRAKAVLGQHVKELVGHTVAMAEYNGHGHAAGRQGHTGHPMPKSNLNLQAKAHVLQNTCDGYGADDPPQTDYGVVDRDQC